MSQPLLSIGMIVKNEERSLENCLKALTPLRQTIPCELVIADTGSTDKTKEIAGKYADILFDFKWVNDFSKARNAVMDKCSGKWFLTVDADEYLLPDTNEIVDFLNSSLSEKKKLASVVIRNHHNKKMNGTFTEFNAIRMVRTATNIRYEGSIHEHFNFTSTDECQILTDTVFNHDGYANISPQHIAEKEKRNLELLEEELKASPQDLRLILQCLESSTQNPEKRIYYTNLAFRTLQNMPTPTNDGFAPICAYKALSNAEIDKSTNLSDWFDWTFKTFTSSNYILIDAKYIYIKYLFNNKEYEKIIEAGSEFLTAIKNFTKNKISAENPFLNPIVHIHPIHINTIKTLIANAFIETKQTKNALKLLEEIDFDSADNYVITNWFYNITLLDAEAVTKVTTNKLNSLFLKQENNENVDTSLMEHTNSIIKGLFSCSQEKPHYKIFSSLDNDLGISARLCEAKTKKEAEKLLGIIKDWNKLMPSALKQAIILKADLPKEFYSTNQAHLSFLINDISDCAEELVDVLTEHYSDTQKFNYFGHISFIFNLLTTIILNKSNNLSDISQSKYLEKLLDVSNEYLNICYNPELLQNEEAIVCILPQHLFCWYLIKAHTRKLNAPLEYIKTLRLALNRIPESKPVIEFLIAELQKEDAKKKQEQIKNASPELIALAEQLKTMLSAFPEDSPELLAIKESPMYKQVAFLIEN